MSHRVARREPRRTVDDARDEPPARPQLAPELLLRLQRSAGNAAVSRLLQRKFGFEVETNIGLRNIADATFVKKDVMPWEKAKTQQKVVTTHPTVTADNSVGSGGQHFAIKVDHHNGQGATDPSLANLTLQNLVVLPNPSSQQVGEALEYDEPAVGALRGPIAEFVTDPPLDEFTASESEVRDSMTAMGTAAIKLKGVPTRAALADHYTGAVQPGVRVGVKDRPRTIGGVNKKVELQTTVGLQLEHVQQYFQDQSKSPKITDPGPNKPWESTAENKDALIEALAVQNGSQLMTSLTLDPAANPEWTGAMTLLSQYLLATLYNPGFGWGKNKVGMFFYKSKLSDVFNGLSTAEVKLYKDALLKVNRVAASAKIAGGGVLAGEWLDEVLGGKQDRVFEGLKNPYSTALGPEMIGASGDEKVAVVMEKRKGGPPLPPATSWSSEALETSATAWGDLGVLVYSYLRDLHRA